MTARLLALMCVLATAAGTAAAWTAAHGGAGQTGDLPLVNIVTLSLPLMWAAATVFTALILPPRRRPAGSPRARAAAPQRAGRAAARGADAAPTLVQSGARVGAASHVTAAHASPGGAVADSARALLAAVSPGRATIPGGAP